MATTTEITETSSADRAALRQAGYTLVSLNVDGMGRTVAGWTRPDGKRALNTIGATADEAIAVAHKQYVVGR